jgi:hypothetical protein
MIGHHEAGHEIKSVTWIQLAEDSTMGLCHRQSSSSSSSIILIPAATSGLLLSVSLYDLILPFFSCDSAIYSIFNL